MTNPAVIGTHQANPWIDNIMNYMEPIFSPTQLLHKCCVGFSIVAQATKNPTQVLCGSS